MHIICSYFSCIFLIKPVCSVILSTMLFCRRNSSSVSMPSSRRCWRQRSCSRFFIRMLTTLVGEQQVEDGAAGCGKKAFAKAVAAFENASERDSLRGC